MIDVGIFQNVICVIDELIIPIDAALAVPGRELMSV
jgi:hypothetical protein